MFPKKGKDGWPDSSQGYLYSHAHTSWGQVFDSQVLQTKYIMQTSVLYVKPLHYIILLLVHDCSPFHTLFFVMLEITNFLHGNIGCIQLWFNVLRGKPPQWRAHLNLVIYDYTEQVDNLAKLYSTKTI